MTYIKMRKLASYSIFVICPHLQYIKNVSLTFNFFLKYIIISTRLFSTIVLFDLIQNVSLPLFRVTLLMQVLLYFSPLLLAPEQIPPAVITVK